MVWHFDWLCKMEISNFLFHFPYMENYWIALLSLQIKKSNNEMITRLHILNFWLLKKVSHAYFFPLEISFWKRKIPNNLVYERGCFVMHSSFSFWVVSRLVSIFQSLIMKTLFLTLCTKNHMNEPQNNSSHDVFRRFHEKKSNNSIFNKTMEFLKMENTSFFSENDCGCLFSTLHHHFDL